MIKLKIIKSLKIAMTDDPLEKLERSESKLSFDNFEGYPEIPEEERKTAINQMISAINQSEIEAKAREVVVNQNAPRWIKELTKDDVATWVRDEFIQAQFAQFNDVKMEELTKRAKEGDKAAIVIIYLFENNLSHYDIVKRWGRITDFFETWFKIQNKTIHSENGDIIPADYEQNVDKITEEVTIAQKKLDEIIQGLNEEGSQTSERFDEYVGGINKERREERKRFLKGKQQDIDWETKRRINEVKAQIASAVDLLARWQQKISKFFQGNLGEFGPSSITIPNYAEYYSTSLRGFGGEVIVDEETGDLTLDLSAINHSFSNPPEFEGLHAKGTKAMLVFKMREEKADGTVEEYEMHLGFKENYAISPYIQFVCSETGDRSEEISFGIDTRPNLTSIVRKPVIYFYSDKNINASVNLNYDGEFTSIYPNFTDENIWEIRTLENGLIRCSGKQLPYLFWEGIPRNPFKSKFIDGFCVSGVETGEFLDENLTYLGLNPRERADFITYWLPVLQKNKYNLIRFAMKEYEERVILEIVPKPAQMIRVFMTFRGVDSYKQVETQQLQKVSRKLDEFIVVEWGGVDLSE